MTRALFLSLLLLTCVNAQAAEVSLSGTVLEKGTRKPLAGVTLSVAGNAAIRSSSDAQGQFTLTLPDAGNYNLTAEKSGAYNAESLAIQVDSGADTALTQVLSDTDQHLVGSGGGERTQS